MEDKKKPMIRQHLVKMMILVSYCLITKSHFRDKPIRVSWAVLLHEYILVFTVNP